MARELKICPPTWNEAIGRVPFRIAVVGLLNLPVHFALSHKMQYPATKKNCTIVNVTGNLKLFKMTLPVLFDSAEERYHSVQSATNRNVG